MIAPIFKLVINEDIGKTEFHQLMEPSENIIVQKIRQDQVIHELSYTKEEWEVILNKIFPIFKYDFDLKFNHDDYYKKIVEYRENLSESFLNSIKTYFTNLLEKY